MATAFHRLTPVATNRRCSAASRIVRNDLGTEMQRDVLRRLQASDFRTELHTIDGVNHFQSAPNSEALDNASSFLEQDFLLAQ